MPCWVQILDLGPNTCLWFLVPKYWFRFVVLGNKVWFFVYKALLGDSHACACNLSRLPCSWYEMLQDPVMASYIIWNNYFVGVPKSRILAFRNPDSGKSGNPEMWNLTIQKFGIRKFTNIKIHKIKFHVDHFVGVPLHFMGGKGGLTWSVFSLILLASRAIFHTLGLLLGCKNGQNKEYRRLLLVCLLVPIFVYQHRIIWYVMGSFRSTSAWSTTRIRPHGSGLCHGTKGWHQKHEGTKRDFCFDFGCLPPLPWTLAVVLVAGTFAMSLEVWISAVQPS